MLERYLGANAVVEEAVDHLVEEAFREAMTEQDLLPLASPEVEITQSEEGKPLIFKTIVHVRPDVTIGDYEHFGFQPEIKPVDETMVEKVLDELREDQGSLEPVTDRGGEKGDYAVLSFVGTRDGVAFRAARRIACRSSSARTGSSPVLRTTFSARPTETSANSTSSSRTTTRKSRSAARPLTSR